MGTQHLNPEQRKERAKLAARTRWDQHTPISQRAADRIARIIDNAPPFTPEQVAFIHKRLAAAQEAQA